MLCFGLFEKLLREKKNAVSVKTNEWREKL